MLANEKNIHFPTGLEIDLDRAWSAIIERQFGGDPGRAFGELIQNLLDSYPSTVPLSERRGAIIRNGDRITIEDYGEGMDRKRLNLLRTLGGTDKVDDDSSIGKFGIGFFSVFNPTLGTRKVTVRTRCEGRFVEIVFEVKEPSARPSVRGRVISTDHDYSTRIEVLFDNDGSTQRCAEWARMALLYYPCTVTIDGAAVSTVWQKAADAGYEIFTDGACQGFIEPSYLESVQVLCKFERLAQYSVGNYSTGGHGMKRDLRDLERRHIPYVPGMGVTLNCNNLNIPIGRQGFKMDWAYEASVRCVARELGLVLVEQLASLKEDTRREQLVVANQFILAAELRAFLEAGYEMARCNQPPEVLGALAEAKVYALAGKEGRFSLADIWRMKSSGLPLYFSPESLNVGWLRGGFTHDFIVCPTACTAGGGAPDLYNQLFSIVFSDVVNLDTVSGDQATIAKLVERGIVDRDILAPKTCLVADPDIAPEFVALLDEINQLLGDDVVRGAVRKSLKIPAKRITAAFFAVQQDNATIPTALLESDGDAYVPSLDPPKPRDLVLGLQLEHPLIQGLAGSSDPYRAYFALSYLAGELLRCQRILVPYSSAFNRVKRDLTRQLRKGLIERFAKTEARAPRQTAHRVDDSDVPRNDGARSSERPSAVQ